MSTCNLCLGIKIRKIGIPLQTPVLLYKSEVQWGIHYMDMFFVMRDRYSDVYCNNVRFAETVEGMLQRQQEK